MLCLGGALLCCPEAFSHLFHIYNRNGLTWATSREGTAFVTTAWSTWSPRRHRAPCSCSRPGSRGAPSRPRPSPATRGRSLAGTRTCRNPAPSPSTCRACPRRSVPWGSCTCWYTGPDFPGQASGQAGRAQGVVGGSSTLWAWIPPVTARRPSHIKNKKKHKTVGPLLVRPPDGVCLSAKTRPADVYRATRPIQTHLLAADRAPGKPRVPWVQSRGRIHPKAGGPPRLKAMKVWLFAVEHQTKMHYFVLMCSTNSA